MRRFHSNAGSFGQPRCDRESPRVLLGTVLFAFLEALKLSPSTLLSLHFGEGQMHVPRFAGLMVRLSNSRKCSEHPLQTLANLREMRLIFPTGLGETKTYRYQRLVVAAHTIYGLQSWGGNGRGQDSPALLPPPGFRALFWPSQGQWIGRTYFCAHWTVEMMRRDNTCKERFLVLVLSHPLNRASEPPLLPAITHDC